MTRFIWVRDADKLDHYLNVNHIIRVTKVAAHGQFSAYAYIMLRDGNGIRLSTDKYDTADDVIAKIGVALV
jgi:arginyl-tRNA synthetase